MHMHAGEKQNSSDYDAKINSNSLVRITIMKSYKNITEYIKSYPKDVQPTLEVLRQTIKKSAPKAEEAIKYGIPTFVLGDNLVHFGAYKNHIGFYPASSGISAFAKELSRYETSKGTVQFPLDQKLPLPLITKIVKWRVKENLAKGQEKRASSNKQHIVYHKDGSIWAKGTMTHGKMNGYWEWFRKDGTKTRSGYFDNGKQVGVWTTYDQKGTIYKVTKMTKK